MTLFVSLDQLREGLARRLAIRAKRLSDHMTSTVHRSPDIADFEASFRAEMEGRKFGESMIENEEPLVQRPCICDGILPRSDCPAHGTNGTQR